MNIKLRGSGCPINADSNFVAVLHDVDKPESKNYDSVLVEQSVKYILGLSV